MTTGCSNIALAGFMGTGKSTVGRLVAARLDWPFVDVDDVIEARAGCSIAAIFATEGEATFRQLEAEVCRELAARPQHVIATGGGALLDPTTRAAFEAHSLLVCLRADLDTIMQRVGNDPGRPLFAANQTQLARLLAARAPVYDSLPHQIDTTHRTPQQVAEEIVALWHT